MSFALLAPGGFAFGERLPSSWANAIDADHAAAIDGVGGGTYAPTNPIVIGGDGMSVTGDFAATHDCAIGTTDADTLTVNSTVDFQGPVTFADTLTVNDFVAGTGAQFNGTVALGNAAGDAISVTGTLTINNNCTIGSSASDTLTINASTVFNEVSFTGDVEFTGTASFEGDVNLGTGSGDDIDVSGILNLHFPVAFSGQGRVTFRYALLTDADATLTVSAGNVFRVPTSNTAPRTYTLGTTNAEDGDFMIFYKGATGTLPEDVNLNSPTANEDSNYSAGAVGLFTVFVFDGSSWRLAFRYAA